jgi:probable HAF family extracellular repeat protein
VLWENKNAPPISIGNFDGGVAWNTPTAINNRGLVVGFANQAGSQGGAFNPIAFFWDKQAGFQPIPPVGDDTNNLAWGISNHGVVVGQSFGGTDDPTGRAFIYEGGVATDLNSLIQPNSSLQLELANDITEEGEIVGFALDATTGSTVAFLAVPVGGSDGLATAASQAERGIRAVASDKIVPPLAGTFSRFLSDAGQSK